ncbi:hypothetical protein [Amycolatopsis anabasis]|uniref:hypothetical protein n=1 Tax=Amycolatopsis anabasis TaxID=1840409 RepID=UPI00131C36D8|nr:hypothetical protein [Amycolatopsis anabasis]
MKEADAWNAARNAFRSKSRALHDYEQDEFVVSARQTRESLLSLIAEWRRENVLAAILTPLREDDDPVARDLAIKILEDKEPI